MCVCGIGRLCGFRSAIAAARVVEKSRTEITFVSYDRIDIAYDASEKKSNITTMNNVIIKKKKIVTIYHRGTIGIDR